MGSGDECVMDKHNILAKCLARMRGQMAGTWHQTGEHDGIRQQAKEDRFQRLNKTPRAIDESGGGPTEQENGESTEIS